MQLLPEYLLQDLQELKHLMPPSGSQAALLLSL
jgi:hypothetical protein